MPLKLKAHHDALKPSLKPLERNTQVTSANNKGTKIIFYMCVKSNLGLVSYTQFRSMQTSQQPL